MVYIEVGDCMKVDTEKIEWLLNNVTQYRISKDTGVTLSILSRLVKGERKIENLTIKTGSALTEYAEKLQKQED
jgi:DNA-binding protein